MRSIVLFFVFLGVIFITMGYVKSNMKCPPPIVKYQYVPQSFKEEQYNQKPVSATFGTMFNKDSPWVNSVLNYN